MTKAEARQRIMKILADDCLGGIMDVADGNKSSDDVTRGVIQSLCDICYDLIEALPEGEVVHKWTTYDRITIRDEYDRVVSPVDAVRIHNDLVSRIVQ